MVFIIASSEPTIFILLTELDVNDMRGGRSKFVDQRSTNGGMFDKVVVSLHKNQQEIEEMITKAGHGRLLKGMPSPEPLANEGKCTSCSAIILEASMLDGRCIMCWRELGMKFLNKNKS